MDHVSAAPGVETRRRRVEEWKREEKFGNGKSDSHPRVARGGGAAVKGNITSSSSSDRGICHENRCVIDGAILLISFEEKDQHF